MPYFLTENFSAGVDTRKHPITAPSGTLRQMDNLHVTPGGEIEKRLAFIEAEDASGTLKKSLMRIGATIWIVGTGVDRTYGDLFIRYVTGPTINSNKELLDWDVFDGRLYYIVLDKSNDTVEHWYQDIHTGTPLVLPNTSTVVLEGKGRYVRTYRSKMYSCEGQLIYFSVVGDPTIWDDPVPADPLLVGNGFINASANDAEAVDLQGLEVYYDTMAFFSSRAIQIWDMDADPANNIQKQTVRAIGVAGRATPRQYGPGDILFLAPSGIRSLQARDSSNSAAVSDVGSPIDLNIRSNIVNDTDATLADTRTLLEDLTGRFWMMFDHEIWVLSLFPGPNVSAWSRYLPTHSGTTPFVPVELVDAAGYVCVRSSDDKIYVLGGDDRDQYDACVGQFQMPYLGFEKPATWKQFLGFDAALDGTWMVEMSLDPDNVQWENVGTVTKSTYNDQTIAFRGYSPACSIRMTTVSVSKARVANVALHYNLSKDD